jgi:hypothetical protein
MTGARYDEGTVIQNFSSGRAVHRICRMKSTAKIGQPIMIREHQPLEPPRLRVRQVCTADRSVRRSNRFGTCFKLLGIGA